MTGKYATSVTSTAKSRSVFEQETLFLYQSVWIAQSSFKEDMQFIAGYAQFKFALNIMKNTIENV